MNNKKLTEAIYGLPDTKDPYIPSTRMVAPEGEPPEETKPVEVPSEITPTPEEPEKILPPGEKPSPIPDWEVSKVIEPLKPGEAGEELPGSELPEEPEPTAWEPHQLPNKKDLGFRRADGFYLRARKVESTPNKWMAQVYRDNEILDKGQVIIPAGMRPDLYIQKIADYMLDAESQRFEQKRPSGKPSEELGLGDENLELF